MSSSQSLGFRDFILGLSRADQVKCLELTFRILENFNTLNIQDTSRPNFSDKIQAVVGIPAQMAEPMLSWLQSNNPETLHTEARGIASALNLGYGNNQEHLSGQSLPGQAGPGNSEPRPSVPLHKQNIGLLGYHIPDPNSPIDWNTLALQKSTQYVGVLQDFDHAMAVKAEYTKSNNREGNAAAVSDFPHNDLEAQRELVKEIYEAIVDVSNVMDAQRRKRGAPRGIKRHRTQNGSADVEHDSEDDSSDVYGPNHQVRRAQNLSIVQGEILAWQLLGYIRDAQYGHVNIPTWSLDFGYDRSFPNFRARLDCVLEALRSSKAIVSSFMNSDIMRRMAAHPKKELKRKTSNKLQNADRDVQVKVGIHAMKTKQVVVGEDGIYDLNHNKIDAKHPQPRKLLETASRIQNRKIGLGQMSGVRPPGSSNPEMIEEEPELPEFIPATIASEAVAAAARPIVAAPPAQLSDPTGPSRQEADDVIYIGTSPSQASLSETNHGFASRSIDGGQRAAPHIQSMPLRPRPQRLSPLPTLDNPMGSRLAPASSGIHTVPIPAVPAIPLPNWQQDIMTQSPTPISHYSGASLAPAIVPQMSIMPQQISLSASVGHLGSVNMGFLPPLFAPAGQSFGVAGPATINPADMALPPQQPQFHGMAPQGFGQPSSVAEQMPTPQAVTDSIAASNDAEWWQDQSNVNEIFDQFINGSGHESFWS